MDWNIDYIVYDYIDVNTPTNFLINNLKNVVKMSTKSCKLNKNIIPRKS